MTHLQEDMRNTALKDCSYAQTLQQWLCHFFWYNSFWIIGIGVPATLMILTYLFFRNICFFSHLQEGLPNIASETVPLQRLIRLWHFFWCSWFFDIRILVHVTFRTRRFSPEILSLSHFFPKRICKVQPQHLLMCEDFDIWIWLFSRNLWKQLII